MNPTLILISILFCSFMARAQNSQPSPFEKRLTANVVNSNVDALDFKTTGETSELYSLSMEKFQPSALTLNKVVPIESEVICMPFDSTVAIDSALIQKAYDDAASNYHGYKLAGTGTLLSSILTTPVGGLITAVSCSQTPPKKQSLNISSNVLENDPIYFDAYKNRAHKIKKQKVWGNFVIGTSIFTVVGFIVVKAIQVADDAEY